MAPQAFKKCGLLPPDHHRLTFSTRTGINSEKVHGTFSVPRSCHGWRLTFE